MKKMLVILILLILVNNCLSGERIHFSKRLIFEISDSKFDKWNGNDKLVHMLGAYILNQNINKKYSCTKSFIIVQMLSIFWEVKDGFISYKTIGYFGGEGFSYKDHIAVTIGQILQLLIDRVIWSYTNA